MLEGAGRPILLILAKYKASLVRLTLALDCYKTIPPSIIYIKTVP